MHAYIILSIIVLLFSLIFCGVNIVYACILIGFLGLSIETHISTAISIIGMIPHSKVMNYHFSILPMFILTGYLAFASKMTEPLFDAAKKWFSWIPGGLAIATIFSIAVFAAISGASTATAAIFSRIATPKMIASGYSKKISSGVVAASGTLASLIPPSGILVIFGIITEQSIAKLLVAGLLPGILSAVIYIITIIILSILNPSSVQQKEDYSFPEKIKSIPQILPAISITIFIFSAIFFGFATPTEAGAISAFAMLLYALIKRTQYHCLKEAFIETVKLSVIIYSIIWGVLIFVRYIGFLGFTQHLQEYIPYLHAPRLLVLTCILLMYILLGMFMDAIGMLLLTLPVVLPIIIDLGYSPIWFGIILVKMVEVCLITPPIGLNCFVVASTSKGISTSDVFKGVIPFLIADFITIVILIAFPGITLLLPSLMR